MADTAQAIAFYLDDDREERRLELWNGVLG
jgi:hypothetical protein